MYIREIGRLVKCIRSGQHKRDGNDRNFSSLYAKHFMENKYKFVNSTNKYKNFEVGNR